MWRKCGAAPVKSGESVGAGAKTVRTVFKAISKSLGTKGPPARAGRGRERGLTPPLGQIAPYAGRAYLMKGVRVPI